ncbi:iron complex outermembrane receptor protein [Paucibacter oligotrophus]|uniref:Iron complex outermembrane receptor protein n=1 Tax=Roseateles oligotrophus TaxID=1769250 RepID=A0A840L486_9BURK|nr:TonB-dependent receptor [Roseateles oligotrophus]MBB4841512.1 iron complex outermembrane receptor protein [Roseateles oligotrophus]
MQTTFFARRPLALGAHLLCLSLATLPLISAAQQSAASPAVLPAEATSAGTSKLERVITTGNPLRSADLAQPADVLSGDALILRRGATLGETLDGLPGVGASYFGPNSNRPTIRGLDGDRVRMLSNSGSSVDASSLSFDHAVPLDPLLVEKVEVLRGAAALLYGGNAVGGVVNTLDNRIPRKALGSFGGAAELRLGGASGERNAALLLEGGTGEGRDGLAWHADLSGRRAGDQLTPRFSSVDGSSRHVRNSASDSHGGALGASYVFANGFAGLSLDDYRSEYGVTVEPDIKIKMQRQRLAAAGEWRAGEDKSALLQRLGWQLSRSDYEHKEIEGTGEVGTVFKSRGNDLRLEAEHRAFGPVRGVLGLQWEKSDFSALGEEALVPSSRTQNSAVFLLEQYEAGPLSLSAGARAEAVRVDSDGDAADAAEPKFGAASRREFKPRSFSLSGSYALNSVAPGLSLNLNLNSSERAPMFYELHAKGVHVASGAFERGDANLGLEKARGLDLGLQWKTAGQLLRLNVYQTRFSSYIALDATGETHAEPGAEALPVYAFKSVPALLKGFELEGRWTLPAQWLPGALLNLSAQLDGVRGENRATGEALPRLAPLRATFGLDAQQGAWSGRLEWRLAARQDRVPVLDKPTAGYGIVKLSLARQFMLGSSDALWYLKLDNLTNKLAYSAASVATIRDLSPLAGRSLHTGVQVRF